MKRLPFLALGLAIAACGSTIPPVAAGQFTGPSGLAVTSAGDRDLLFVANEGRDNLRALQMCTNAIPDGGTDPCKANEDFQFLPAPIRVFPATIETGDRPRRLAGVRLTRPDLPGQTEARAGVVLAVGADNNLRIVDARNLVEATQGVQQADGGTVPAKPVLSLPLPTPASDVVAENPLDASGLEIATPAGQAATAFVSTVAQGSVPAQLFMLSVGLDANGAATVPTIVGQCVLTGVVPRKLGVVPGGGDRVYVADGAGDGVVSVAKAGFPAPANPPAPCTMDRISAGGRPARSVSLSPAWVGPDATAHAPGELLIMVLDPLPTGPAGMELDTGGILIARTADKSIVPVPPFGLFEPTTAADGGVTADAGTPMEPMSTPAMPREATFLRALPTDPLFCPATAQPGADGGTVTPGACTLVYVGTPLATPVARFNLLAAVSSTDGASYFLDVVNRRFVSVSLPLGTTDPTIAINPLVPGTADPNQVVLTPLAADDTHAITGWLTEGVTPTSQWRVIFQPPMPALEARAGTLTVGGNGNYLLKLPGVNLQSWVTDPALKLSPGDAVSFTSYQVPPGSPAACSDLVSKETAARFELSILSIPAADTVELAPLQSSATVAPFNLSACPSGLGVVASVRAAGDHPWLVYENFTVRGRAKNGENFVATGRRFDYPIRYTRDFPPGPSDNTSVGFVLTGNDPPYSGNVFPAFTFSLNTGLSLVPMLDPTLQGAAPGLATTVLNYSSPRHPLLVFTAVTGANTLVQADPSVLTSQPPPIGETAYK